MKKGVLSRVQKGMVEDSLKAVFALQKDVHVNTFVPFYTYNLKKKSLECFYDDFLPTNLENFVLFSTTFHISLIVFSHFKWLSYCAVTTMGKNDQVRHAIIACLHWRAVCTVKIEYMGGTDWRSVCFFFLPYMMRLRFRILDKNSTARIQLSHVSSQRENPFWTASLRHVYYCVHSTVSW